MIVLCFNILVWGAVLIPWVGWLVSKGWKKGLPFGIVGGCSMGLGFGALPWLNLYPLKEEGLDWLWALTPPILEVVVRRVGLDELEILKWIGVLELIFEPRGWLTLGLVVSPLLGIFLLVLGGINWALGIWVSWRRFAPLAGKVLVGGASIHLILLFYFLPEVDGLGERAFPSFWSLVVTLLEAKIEWAGVLAMMIGLIFMIVAGIYAQNQFSSYESEPNEWNESTELF